MLRAPARTAFEMAASLAAIVRARARVRRLEREVLRGDLKELRRKKEHASAGAPDIVYLRATPGAGTQVVGASSHINGFINAALAQGARVRLVSNDRIAGLDESKVPLKLIEPEPVGSMRVDKAVDVA